MMMMPPAKLTLDGLPQILPTHAFESHHTHTGDDAPARFMPLA